MNYNSDFKAENNFTIKCLRWILGICIGTILIFVILLVTSLILDLSVDIRYADNLLPYKINKNFEMIEYRRGKFPEEPSTLPPSINHSRCSFDDFQKEVICTNLSLSETLRYLLEFNATSFELRLRRVEFPDNELSDNWYYIKKNVLSLRISESHLTGIDVNAFKSEVFDLLQKLELHDVNIDHIHEHTFNSLNKLSELTIHNQAIQFQCENFLRPIFDTLKTFRYQNTKDALPNDPQKLFSLPSGYIFINLLHVELRRNNYADFIKAETFANIKSVRTLIICEAQITSIGNHAFRLLKNLIYLDLSKNLLKTLSNDFFIDVFALNRNLTDIDLSDNIWNCDCDLLPLHENYLEYKEKFNNKIYCELPKRYEDHLLEDANLCTENDSTQYLIGAAGGLAIGLICGALMMFVGIRWKPTLLKGNKRVVIVNKNKEGILVLPKITKTCSKYTRSTSYSSVDNKRLADDISVISNISYISPNIYEVIGYKAIEKKYCEYFEKIPNNSPPPLPKRLSRKSTFTPEEIIEMRNDFKIADENLMAEKRTYF